ncbi:hypothetical protein BBJ29_002237 [Phytophthora kernoviae]|uniref:Major facilitator superfamily associated domain-containing protein n=1 Tax=Phytophthora kernoviae TaxID=325452 RepID=A0A3F2RH07_9STRA|nr:hypothetical protein BBP00_00007899 [Phytophthora kernoviae]RLN70915.1 hypothetical protein BBJ29_002237 [Phytophthora kernoviae]
MHFRPMFLLDAGEAKELVPLKIFYAIYYYCNSLVAYLPIFYEESNFTKSEIGILLAIPCVCTILAPPIWGAIADSLRRHKHIHVLCYVTSCLLFFAIQFVHSFPLMCVVVLGTYCQMMPNLALMDLAAMKLATRHGGDFGKQRLYGAFGYGVGGYVSGVMASSVGLKWCFTMMLGISCISLILLLWYIPASSYSDEDEHPPQKGINGGFIDGYLFLNVYDLSDNGATIVSVFVAVETLSEIPLFFLSNSMIKRFGSAVCLCIVVAALFIRDMVYIHMEQPWHVIPVETLHGVTFGLLLATLTTYLYTAAPKGAAGSMIGLLTAFQRGIGSGIASLAGGYIYDDYGVRTIWKIGAFGVVPASFVFISIFEWFARQRHAVAVELEDRLVDEDNSSSELNKYSPVQ